MEFLAQFGEAFAVGGVVLAFGWWAFTVYAKRSKATWDDEMVATIRDVAPSFNVDPDKLAKETMKRFGDDVVRRVTAK